MPGDPHPFLVAPDRFDKDGGVRFPQDEAHHVLRVVRLKIGDTCRVVDGQGGRFRVRLQGSERDLIGVILESTREAEPERRLDLGFPVLRTGGRTDWLIEKGVEVGVDRFVPIAWERSIRGTSASARRRWARIVREARKPSERARLPSLANEEAALAAVGGGGPTTLADPAGGEAWPGLAAARPVLLLVGPEGGVAAGERDLLCERGAVLWGLGSNRLRAETAAIVGSHRLAGALRRAGAPA